MDAAVPERGRDAWANLKARKTTIQRIQPLIDAGKFPSVAAFFEEAAHELLDRELGGPRAHIVEIREELLLYVQWAIDNTDPRMDALQRLERAVRENRGR